MSELNDLCVSLAEKKREIEGLRICVQDAMATLEQLQEYKVYEAHRLDLANSTTELTVLENKLRQVAIMEFNATGNKKPANGIGIRCGKSKPVITDKEIAISWAKANMPIAIIETLDESVILSWAEKQKELPDWIEIENGKVTATIASNIVEIYTNEEQH